MPLEVITIDMTGGGYDVINDIAWALKQLDLFCETDPTCEGSDTCAILFSTIKSALDMAVKWSRDLQGEDDDAAIKKLEGRIRKMIEKGFLGTLSTDWKHMEIAESDLHQLRNFNISYTYRNGVLKLSSEKTVC